MPWEQKLEKSVEFVTENLLFAGVGSVAGRCVLSAAQVAQKTRFVNTITSALRAQGEGSVLAKVFTEPVELVRFGGTVDSEVFGKAIKAIKANPELLAQEGKNLSRVVLEVAEDFNTGTVWDSIKKTDVMYNGTRIPRSFELTVGNQKFWVHPNATEHMWEYIEKNQYHGMPVNSQSLLKSFRSAVEKAIENGIKYTNDPIIVDCWELMFSSPRSEGLYPVIKHAVYRP